MAMVRYVDRTLIPMAADAAGWCETQAFRTEQAVIRAPFAGVFIALLGGVLLGVCVLHRTRLLQAYVKRAR
jgi:hypothetical protein